MKHNGSCTKIFWIFFERGSKLTTVAHAADAGAASRKAMLARALPLLAILIVVVPDELAQEQADGIGQQHPFFSLPHIAIFPNESLDLRIFEHRYRQLLGRCVGDPAWATPVGDVDPCVFVTLYEAPERFRVGATGSALVIDLESVATYDDGTSTLTARGLGRVTVRSEPWFEHIANGGEPLAHANVSFWHDRPCGGGGTAGEPAGHSGGDAPKPEAGELDGDSATTEPVEQTQAWQRVRRRMKHLFGRQVMRQLMEQVEATSLPDASSRSFALAALLPFGFEARRELLHITCSSARLQRMGQMLGEWLARIQAREGEL